MAPKRKSDEANGDGKKASGSKAGTSKGAAKVDLSTMTESAFKKSVSDMEVTFTHKGEEFTTVLSPTVFATDTKGWKGSTKFSVKSGDMSYPCSVSLNVTVTGSKPKKAATASKKKAAEDDDELEEEVEEEEAPKKKAVVKKKVIAEPKKAASKKQDGSDDEAGSASDEEAPKPKKKAKK